MIHQQVSKNSTTSSGAVTKKDFLLKESLSQSNIEDGISGNGIEARGDRIRQRRMGDQRTSIQIFNLIHRSEQWRVSNIKGVNVESERDLDREESTVLGLIEYVLLADRADKAHRAKP